MRRIFFFIKMLLTNKKYFSVKGLPFINLLLKTVTYRPESETAD